MVQAMISNDTQALQAQLQDEQLVSWASTGAYLTRGGRRIFYKQEGEGKPLVLIHGFPTSSWDWNLLWPQLISQYTCIAPDLFGFGFSDKPADFEYSIADQADWVEVLLTQLGITEAILLAHDYGDTVTQELMARQLDRQNAGEEGMRWQSVILLNGGLFPESHQPRPIQHLLNSAVGFLISRLLTRKRFGKSFSAVFGEEHQPTTADLDQFWELITLYGGHRIAHRLIRYIRERKQYRERWVGALVHWQQPLCLIDGPDDPVSGRHLAERFQELVPQASCHLLEGVGHYPQVEAPDSVLGQIARFLS